MGDAGPVDDMYFFGCNKEAGHHLFRPGGGWADFRCRELLPFKYEQLDGGILLPRPEKVGNGSLVYLFGWTILSWWGSPFDTRGAVCNSILLKGKETDDVVWRGFEFNFKELAPKLARPNIVWRYDHGD